MKGQGVLPADGKVAAAKWNKTRGLRHVPRWQLEQEYIVVEGHGVPITRRSSKGERRCSGSSRMCFAATNRSQYVRFMSATRHGPPTRTIPGVASLNYSAAKFRGAIDKLPAPNLERVLLQHRPSAQSRPRRYNSVWLRLSWWNYGLLRRLYLPRPYGSPTRYQ